jgi:hypothetical protein
VIDEPLIFHMAWVKVAEPSIATHETLDVFVILNDAREWIVPSLRGGSSRQAA